MDFMNINVINISECNFIPDILTQDEFGIELIIHGKRYSLALC